MPPARGRAGLVLVRQQQSGLRQQQTVRVELPLGDDPQAVLAVLDGLARVNGIGLQDPDISRQDALAVHQGLIVQRRVLGADIAPVASGI
jgi:hypothetical protein